MFLFESEIGRDPFNSATNLSAVRNIEWVNLKYMKGWENDKLVKEDGPDYIDQYEVKITYMDGVTDIFLLSQEEDINYFFLQLEKLSITYVIKGNSRLRNGLNLKDNEEDDTTMG